MTDTASTAIHPRKHHFFRMGILLVVLIAAFLVALNHFVREENRMHEAMMESVKPTVLPAPTNSAQTLK